MEKHRKMKGVNEGCIVTSSSNYSGCLRPDTPRPFSETRAEKLPAGNIAMSTEKIVLITGSSQGLGFELAKALDQRDMRLILTGRTQHKLEAALSQLSTKKKTSGASR